MYKPLKRSKLIKLWSNVINHLEVTDSWCDSELFDPEKQDPIWYGTDETVVTVELMNRYEILVRAYGEIDMVWYKDGETESDDRCYSWDPHEVRVWLGEHKIFTDDQLQKEADEHLIFNNNNWFEFDIYDKQRDVYLLGDYFYRETLWENYALDIDVNDVLVTIKDYIDELRAVEESDGMIKSCLF